MALMCLCTVSIPRYKTSHAKTSRVDICKPIFSLQSTSMALSLVETLDKRRSANYAPTLWSFDYIQSLSSKYMEEDYVTRADNLKSAVKTMIRKVEIPLSMLEMVDGLQRLGISYHFQDEIRDILEMIYNNYYKTHDMWDTMDLNLKAIGFRLLRQNGYHVPQEIFQNFRQKTQNLKPASHEDMVGMLNLYEASYLSFEDECLLDDARDFTTKYLNKNIEKICESISSFVSHSLELPLHWRVPRVEAMWFIKEYEKKSDMNPILIELAKLDFDMVQAIHIEDLNHASRWWRNTNWDKKLSFSRDRLMEHFVGSIGFGHLPEFSLGRRSLTKVNSIVTALDDIYDVYGTLDELEQFTDVISRWDVHAIDKLPNYMKICFLGFYNTINEIAYSTLIESGLQILPYLTKAWAGLCKAYLKEARWYHTRYTPTLQEYLDNAYESISGPVILMHVNFLITVGSTEEVLQCMKKLENVVYCSSLLFRLADDLGTSSDELERGDTSKSIQCYMHESGTTEGEARAHIKKLIIETWKKLNKERASVNSQFSQEFYDHATNIARTSHFMYGQGDGHGHPDLIKSHVSSLLFSPIQKI